jgi:hypothetical protein
MPSEIPAIVVRESTPRGINIHLTLDTRGAEFCVAMNERIRRVADSEIVFGAGSAMIPHISLVRASLRRDVTSDQVAAAVLDATAYQREALELDAQPPILESLQHRYIMSEITRSHALDDLRSRVRRRLLPILTNLQTDEVAPFHITLGYVRAQQDEVRRILLECREPLAFRAPSVEISNAGPQGTCIGRLYEWMFG